MAVVQIAVLPLGTGSASISEHVARCVDMVEASGLKYELNPMATVVEGDLSEILDLVRELHESPFSAGAPRVITSVAIDDRRDKNLTMSGKLDAVKRLRCT